MGSLTHRAIREWLEHRRSTWPQTPNQHLLITRNSTHRLGPVGHAYLK
jgi:hypothetical protein